MKAWACIACALFASGAWAATPLPAPLYVRGGFNGWDTTLPLRQAASGMHEAVADVVPGYHPFKLGSADWGTEWVIDQASSVDVKPGQPYRIATKAGREGFLFVREAARYRFTLDTTGAAGPTLRVERMAALQADGAAAHPAPGPTESLQFDTWDGKRERATFSATGHALRTYTHSTTMALRDAGPRHASYSERAGQPRIRTGSLPFDALFALALSEMRQDSVQAISDGNYNAGAPVPCECFETGEKWHYVWTRDLSYAAALGLAMLDPQRVRKSLEFKLSGYRSGIERSPAAAGSPDGLQIVQDTGSGGSWPVSTDRVAWAFGAEAALATLAPGERKAFGRLALRALSNTIENDRIAAFDQSTGLYTGEQSFLDWREQSYASWMPGDLASMASSKALSTNVAHYKALTLAASLAREHGDGRAHRRYGAWASQLKGAINRRLWLADAGMYSSLTAGHFDGAPMHKFDWLGQTLAIVTGIANDRQAESILAHYPHGPMGPPVIHPQQPGRPVYHNRAIWPFVTAYGLKAAALHGHVGVADAAYASLVRGAALNLSNMENLEWLSGQPLLLDERQPALSGPVINSKRQLWSVGAYVGMVIEHVFGVSADAGGLRIRPFITSRLRRDTFASAGTLALDNLVLHGRRIGVRIALPPASGKDGVYRVRAVRLDGKAVHGRIAWSAIGDEALVEVELGELAAGATKITRVDAHPYHETPAVYAPPDPGRPRLVRDASGQLRIEADGAPGTTLNVYRNGSLVAQGVHGGWTDRPAPPAACYAVEATYPASGNRSHHSPPACSGHDIALPMTDARADAGHRLSTHTGDNEPGIHDWGRPADRLEVSDIAVAVGGSYAVQLRYRNLANQVNLGISNGVKWLAVKDARGRVVASGVIQMPHVPAASQPAYSTPVQARLERGQGYRIEVSDFYNMSYLRSNATFTGAGGTSGPANRVDLFGVRLRPFDESESQ